MEQHAQLNLIYSEIRHAILAADPNSEVTATSWSSLANANFSSILVCQAMFAKLLLGLDCVVIARPPDSNTTHLPLHLIEKFQSFLIENKTTLSNGASFIRQG